MATIKDMAFDYSMQRGNGKKAYENFMAGSKAVIREIQYAYNIRGVDTMIDRINSYIEELKDQ